MATTVNPTSDTTVSHHTHEHPHGEQGHEIHHEHHGAIDYAEANREYFNKTASAYDEKPHLQEVVASIGRGLLKEYNFDADKTHVMDFACGTGLVSRELALHAKKIVGVDISQGMVDIYNTRVKNQGIPEEEMHAICADIKGEEGELDGQKFDVVVCSMAYHHFASITDVTRKLVFFLKPGGVLLVIDIIKGASQTLMGQHMNDAERKHLVPHAGGFDEAALRPVFEEAGLVDFSFRPRVRVVKGDKAVNAFIAKGVRPVVS
ncbi:S-adenosyl-L-methionine-dependent methyltransferase [Fomitiporia mediterranea MF3/22]|uniref:S-adenosyl-L-methionine-dependent methyltransferase n=1 Tax=Fomitiporia mediterranea (strain MF3/22) TaxID=694068 RepID=UPI0004407FC1|nr:S-adenosyl-L-methionine-dependent methyltransferase [Fomitiporia mediterranea MF3/22]EJC98903.1 S-adenosyl-L-methionine-dependent methyltransferase [Fomitiporia mediterranea MF3/22]